MSDNHVFKRLMVVGLFLLALPGLERNGGADDTLVDDSATLGSLFSHLEHMCGSVGDLCRWTAGPENCRAKYCSEPLLKERGTLYLKFNASYVYPSVGGYMNFGAETACMVMSKNGAKGFAADEQIELCYYDSNPRPDVIQNLRIFGAPGVIDTSGAFESGIFCHGDGIKMTMGELRRKFKGSFSAYIRARAPQPNPCDLQPGSEKSFSPPPPLPRPPTLLPSPTKPPQPEDSLQ